MIQIPKLPSYSNQLIGTVLLVFIVIFGVKIAWDIPQFVDVLGWDEGVYMQNGLNLTKKLQKDWGPVYAIWYFTLSLFKSNPVDVYLLNFQVLTVVPGILFFLYWYFSGYRPIWAAIVGMFLMASHVNFYSWPKISMFTLLILLVTFLATKFVVNQKDKWTIAAGGTLLASYMRPELYLAFVVLFAVCTILHIIFIIKNKKIEKGSIALYILLILGIAVLQKVIGNPLFSMGGMRAMAAFGQHYAYNYAIWNDLRPDTWQLHGEKIFVNDFGLNFDFYHAYLANPEAFTRHVSSNITRYLNHLWSFYTDILLPESIFKLNVIGRSIILTGLFTTLIISGKWKFKLWWEGIKNNLTEWLLLIIVIGPTFISVVLIFPREHYMVLQLPLLLTLLISLSNGFEKDWLQNIPKIPVAALLGTLLILLAPSAASREYFDNFRNPKGTFNQQAAEILSKMELKKDTVRISEDEGGIMFFTNEAVKQHFKWIIGTNKKGSFNHYRDSTQTQLYYVTPLMLYNEKYLQDAEWQYFIKNYEQQGYKKISIEKEWYFLYDTSAVQYSK